MPAHTRRKCGGSELIEIGKDVSERVEITPPRVYVEKLVRPKCVCRKCKSAPIAAPLPYVLPHDAQCRFFANASA